MEETCGFGDRRSADHRHKGFHCRCVSSVLHGVADGIIKVDGNGRITIVSEALEKMTCVPAHEAVGFPIYYVFRFSEENGDFRLSLGECFEAAPEGEREKREAA
jgi:PAS domain-containing protein